MDCVKNNGLFKEAPSLKSNGTSLNTQEDHAEQEEGRINIGELYVNLLEMSFLYVFRLNQFILTSKK